LRSCESDTDANSYSDRYSASQPDANSYSDGYSISKSDANRNTNSETQSNAEVAPHPTTTPVALSGYASPTAAHMML
jgi:hypothetical protein